MSKTSKSEWLMFALCVIFLCGLLVSCGTRYYPDAPRYVGYELR